MTRLYYREAAGAFVVCDLGRAVTLQSVQRWKDDLDSKVMLKNGKPIPAILIGNKSDLLPHGARVQNVENMGLELEFKDCLMTSAKDNVNIHEAMSCLIKEMIANKEESEPTTDPTIVRPSHLNFSYTKGCSQCCGT
ncbi:hypothetical protein GDO81_003613 [Engystomops pustulosus]|nr:hypothetical protein GDO81_003613 [Engystomops pustulosus]